eukprot:8815438-Lingulodinium_polyedra.AAC.1
MPNATSRGTLSNADTRDPTTMEQTSTHWAHGAGTHCHGAPGDSVKTMAKISIRHADWLDLPALQDGRKGGTERLHTTPRTPRWRSVACLS